MEPYITKKRNSFGFTMVELVVVIGMIALIIGVVLASIKASKNKAYDAETRKVISEVALKAEGQEIAPGVIDYQKAFVAVSAPTAIAELAAKMNVDPSAYQFVVSAGEYAITFPLKKGTYYCIDSVSRASGREVAGLFQESGPQNCSNATRTPMGRTTTTRSTGGSPTILLLGANPDNTPYMDNYVEPGFTASDPEDGNLTASVTYTTVGMNEFYCDNRFLRTYSVTDSDGNTSTVGRILEGNLVVRECAAPPGGGDDNGPVVE